MASELYNITWSKFETTSRKAISNLFRDNDFADVTLVCEDENQVKAHKFVLSMSSIFFKSILLKNVHPNPLIYLTGVNFNTLVSIMKFIYLGETQVSQETFPTFMETAQKLKINGLTEIVALGNVTDFTLLEKKQESKTMNEMPSQRNIGDNTSVPDFTQNASFDKLEPVFETENYVPSPIRFKTPRRTKETGVYHCDKCEVRFPDKSLLLKHKKTLHERLMYTCKLCDYTSKQATHLRYHVKSNHYDQ